MTFVTHTQHFSFQWGHPLPEVLKEMGNSTTRLTYETYYKWLPSEASSDVSEIDRKTTLTGPRPTWQKPLNEIQHIST